MKQIIAIILFTMVFLTLLFAEDKKTIQVKFTISEAQYIDFYDSEIDTIEQQCAMGMTELLNDTFGFFHFQVGNSQPVLQIELIDREQNSGSNSDLQEVGFRVTIEPKEKPGMEEPVYWVFRSVERYTEELPDVRDDFIDEIIQTFKIGAQNNREEFVRNILSQVEVADDFYFIQEQKLFILPLADIETNIDKFSIFLIISSVPDDVFGSADFYDTTVVSKSIQDIDAAIQRYHLPNSYPNGSIALKKVVEGTSEISDEELNTRVSDKKIFILKHIPLTNSELKIISPDHLDSNENAIE